MANKKKILFICQDNSGRSQIAQAFLEKFSSGELEIESAGLKPAKEVNPLVIRVMQEAGIDLTRSKPQSVFKLIEKGRLYDYVITVCHDSESKCPAFPRFTKRRHRPFPDPGTVEGTDTEQLEKVRKIREMIKEWLLEPA